MKRMIAMAMVLASVGVGATAMAGYKSSDPVAVWTAYSEAYGEMGTARNSTDTMQYIGCEIVASPTSSTEAYCTARTAAGLTAWCQTTVPALIAVVAGGTGPNVSIGFDWDANNNCTSIGISNYSYNDVEQQ